MIPSLSISAPTHTKPIISLPNPDDLLASHNSKDSPTTATNDKDEPTTVTKTSKPPVKRSKKNMANEDQPGEEIGQEERWKVRWAGRGGGI